MEGIKSRKSLNGAKEKLVGNKGAAIWKLQGHMSDHIEIDFREYWKSLIKICDGYIENKANTKTKQLSITWIMITQ